MSASALRQRFDRTDRRQLAAVHARGVRRRKTTPAQLALARVPAPATVVAIPGMNPISASYKEPRCKDCSTDGQRSSQADSGLTREQAAEAITHLAFYAGWPNAMSALPVAKAVFEKRRG